MYDESLQFEEVAKQRNSITEQRMLTDEINIRKKKKIFVQFHIRKSLITNITIFTLRSNNWMVFGIPTHRN